MNIPEENKCYNYFDVGKIRESRRSIVKVIKIVPRPYVSEETFFLWRTEVQDCPWLYADETDCFIIAKPISGTFMQKYLIFVRTIDNEWFSLGFEGGLLDVNNKYNL